MTYSTGRFDSRLHRIACSALTAGYEVVVYARWEPGETWADDTPEGYRIVRVPVLPALGVPLLRRLALARVRAMRTTSPIGGSQGDHAPDDGAPARRRSGFARVGRALRGAFRTLVPSRWLLFPRRLVPFAVALDAVAEPADIWHGRLIGALPAVARQARRLGGAAIYDSGDVYIESRELAGRRGLYPFVVRWLERRWARSCAAVVTANDAYADLLRRTLGVPRPTVVMNCADVPPSPVRSPDRLRQALGLLPDTFVALYQGGLLTDRGIEQAMDAILELPGHVLVLLGWGSLRETYARRAAGSPYAGRVHVVDAVPPRELLAWTASADVMLIPIQPTSINHRYATPNKLWEALAAGVPVVASDLPGLAAVVREERCGVLVDPTSPRSIADGIRAITGAGLDERKALRAWCRELAVTRFNWRTQEGALLRLFESVRSC